MSLNRVIRISLAEFPFGGSNWYSALGTRKVSMVPFPNATTSIVLWEVLPVILFCILARSF